MSTKAPHVGSGSTLFSGLSFPEMYEQALVRPIFEPWVEPLFDAVGLAAGDRVLDVACGTGIVARRAKERVGKTGTVIGVDVNAGMLGVARRIAPDVDWREGDAGSLPLGANEKVDVALCQQGFQFFPDRAAAAREFRRVLVEGGRVAVSTWRPDDEFALLRKLREVAEKHVGPVVDRRHSLGNPVPIESALREAGFTDVRSTHSSRTIRFDDGATFVSMNAMAMVGMSDARALSEKERQERIEAITRDSVERLGSLMKDGALEYELGTNVVLARA